VQDAANRGKIVSAQVAAQSKKEVEHIKHESKINHTAYENAITPKDEVTEGE
jgi:hypothetical protein